MHESWKFDAPKCGRDMHLEKSVMQIEFKKCTLKKHDSADSASYISQEALKKSSFFNNCSEKKSV